MAEETLVECREPQFMNTLETCLKSEISRLKAQLADGNSAIKKIQMKVAWKWKEAKELEERMKECEENIETFSAILKRLESHNANLQAQIDFMNANLDDAFLVISHEVNEYEGILAEYRETWNEYQAKYEQLPLSKLRSDAKNNLEKSRIKEMMLEYKYKEVGRKIGQSKRISWLRLRVRIVEFAEAMLENRKLNRKIEELHTNIAQSRKELNIVNAELEMARAKVEEANKRRSLQILGMPPPKMYLPRMISTNYTDNRQEQWANKYQHLADTDSISITPSIFEEICINETEVGYTSFQEEEGSSEAKQSETTEASREDCEDGKDRFLENESVIEEEVNDEMECGASEREEDQSNEVSPAEIEPPFKKLRITANEDSGGPSSCMVNRHQSRDRMKIARGESAITEELSRRAQLPRVINVEKVRFDVSSKFERTMQAPQSYREEYCESEAPSGRPASLAEGSFCMDMMSNFDLSGCSNLSPTTCLSNEEDMDSLLLVSGSNLQTDGISPDASQGLHFDYSSKMDTENTKLF